jgi:hypothetical protein
MCSTKAALSLLSHIWQSRKSLQETNALAYVGATLVTTEKSFITLAPGINFDLAGAITKARMTTAQISRKKQEL